MDAIISNTIVKESSDSKEYYLVTSKNPNGVIDATSENGNRRRFHESEVTIVSDPEELQEAESKFNPPC